jgi:cation transport regulator ChaB
MPYKTIRDLPAAQTRGLSPHQKQILLAAFNAALAKYGDEKTAFAVAHAAASKAAHTRKSPRGG